MSGEITIHGDDPGKAMQRVREVLADVFNAETTDEVLNKIGIRGSNAVKKFIKSSTPSGRTYRRGQRTHTASAPGQPPAVDYGRLIGSYTWRLGTEGSERYVEVGTNVVYAPMLEFGTSRMAARPHLRPAITNEAANIANEIQATFAARLRERARRVT